MVMINLSLSCGAVAPIFGLLIRLCPMDYAFDPKVISWFFAISYAFFFAVAIFPPAFKVPVLQISLQQLHRSFKLLLVNHLPAYPQEPLKR
jgi:hypothetical protein